MWVYSKTGDKKLLQTPDEYYNLGPGWGEHPDGPFSEPEPEPMFEMPKAAPAPVEKEEEPEDKKPARSAKP